MCCGWQTKSEHNSDWRRVPPVHMLPLRISPLVWCPGLRPQLLLPIELFARLDVSAQTSILAHELAHVRRKDHLVRLLELLINTLFWWHPVAWWASRELQQSEELCCDALVVGLKHSEGNETMPLRCWIRWTSFATVPSQPHRARPPHNHHFY